MSIPHIVIIISIIIWFLPLFKQYKTEYFLFFLILAINDPINILLMYLHTLNWQFVHITFSVILVYSLLKRNKKNALILISTLLLMYVVVWHYPDINKIFNALIHVVIIFIILNNLFQQLNLKYELNLFLVIFVSYELTGIMKFIVAYTDAVNGMVLFYLTSFLQIIYGILFSFINVNTKVFKLRVKELE